MSLLEEATLALQEGTMLLSRVSRHSQEGGSIHSSKRIKVTLTQNDFCHL